MGQRPLLLIMESGFPNHAVNARRRKRTRPCVVAMLRSRAVAIFCDELWKALK
jgi:hypothetical protein